MSTIRLKLALDGRPSEISSFKDVEWAEAEIGLTQDVQEWLSVLSDLHGFDSIQTYINAKLESDNYGHALVFDVHDVLDFVAPATRHLKGLWRARFLFVEALDSDLFEDQWGENWFEYGVDYSSLKEKDWRDEITAWLKDIEQEEFTAEWNLALDHAIAGRVRELGELVRKLIFPWRSSEREKESQ